MRMADLSRESGVPVPTIKYYLREGLLPPGRPLSATQADYGTTHVERLRLIRALVDVGRLPIAAVRAVLAAVDAEPRSAAPALRTAHDALPPPVPADAPEPPARALAAMERLGWQVRPQSAALRQLDTALAAVDAIGLGAEDDRLDVYADAAMRVARVDLGGLPEGRAADAVSYAILGTVMYEPILLALRRLAQQHLYQSRRAGG
jgi:DNA-binding transcriptional MerR regulator